MIRYFSIIAFSLAALTTGSCAPMKPVMDNQELVIELRLELNKEFFGRSKAESAKLPRITLNNNIVWIVREGYPQFRIYGLTEKEKQLHLIQWVQKWLNEHPDFKSFYLEFYSNKGGQSQWPVLLLEEKLEVEGQRDRATGLKRGRD